MSVRKKPGKSVTSEERHVLGERTFAAITAVEGLQLGPDSRRRMTQMRQRKLSADEQRAEIIRAYAGHKTRR